MPTGWYEIYPATADANGNVPHVGRPNRGDRRAAKAGRKAAKRNRSR